MDTSQLTLPDDFILLSSADDDGRRLLDTERLRFILSGALLAELAVQGAVTVENHKVYATGELPNACRAECERIAQDRPAAAKTWVTRFADRGSWKELSEALVSKGILRREESKVLGLFPSFKYPTANPEVEAQLRFRLQTALDGGQVDERSAALIAFLQAAGLLRKLFPGADKQRVKAIVEGQWASKAAKAAVDAMTAAVTAAVMVSTMSASTAATS